MAYNFPVSEEELVKATAETISCIKLMCLDRTVTFHSATR